MPAGNVRSPRQGLSDPMAIRSRAVVQTQPPGLHKHAPWPVSLPMFVGILRQRLLEQAPPHEQAPLQPLLAPLAQLAQLAPLPLEALALAQRRVHFSRAQPLKGNRYMHATLTWTTTTTTTTTTPVGFYTPALPPTLP